MVKFGFPGFPWAPRVPEAHKREAGDSSGRPGEATLTLPTCLPAPSRLRRESPSFFPEMGGMLAGETSENRKSSLEKWLLQSLSTKFPFRGAISWRGGGELRLCKRTKFQAWWPRWKTTC